MIGTPMILFACFISSFFCRLASRSLFIVSSCSRTRRSSSCVPTHAENAHPATNPTNPNRNFGRRNPRNPSGPPIFPRRRFRDGGAGRFAGAGATATEPPPSSASSMAFRAEGVNPARDMSLASNRWEVKVSSRALERSVARRERSRARK